MQRGGVVAGGGATLLHCKAAVLAAAAQEPDEELALGMRVLAGALTAPQRQILVNAAIDTPAVILHQISEAGAPPRTMSLPARW